MTIEIIGRDLQPHRTKINVVIFDDKEIFHETIQRMRRRRLLKTAQKQIKRRIERLYGSLSLKPIEMKK